MVELRSQNSRLAQVGFAALMAMLLVLAGCSSKEKAGSGQSLARVDGQDITVLQLNAELMQSNIPSAQKDIASKKFLDALIDRQLLQEQAAKDKIDRDPAVVAAIERAKAQIIAQAYLQRRLAKVARPTKEEIDKYYLDHPDFFADRKVYEFDQIIIESKNFDAELKSAVGTTKSLDDIAHWLKEHHIEYGQNSASSNTVELPVGLVKKLKDMHKGQVFALAQSDKSVIAAIKNVKDAPIKQEVAEPQIANFLMNQRNKEAADTEMSHLRATAKIEYLDKKLAGTTSPATSDAAKKKVDDADHVKRGVADL